MAGAIEIRDHRTGDWAWYDPDAKDSDPTSDAAALLLSPGETDDAALFLSDPGISVVALHDACSLPQGDLARDPYVIECYRADSHAEWTRWWPLVDVLAERF